MLVRTSKRKGSDFRGRQWNYSKIKVSHSMLEKWKAGKVSVRWIFFYIHYAAR